MSDGFPRDPRYANCNFFIVVYFTTKQLLAVLQLQGFRASFAFVQVGFANRDDGVAVECHRVELVLVIQEADLDFGQVGR